MSAEGKFKLSLDATTVADGTKTVNGFTGGVHALQSLLAGDFVSAAQSAGSSIKTLTEVMKASPILAIAAAIALAITGIAKAFEYMANQQLEKTKQLARAWKSVGDAISKAYGNEKKTKVYKATKEAEGMIESGRTDEIKSRLDEAKARQADALLKTRQALHVLEVQQKYGDKDQIEKAKAGVKQAGNELNAANDLVDVWETAYEEITKKNKDELKKQEKDNAAALKEDLRQAILAAKDKLDLRRRGTAAEKAYQYEKLKDAEKVADLEKRMTKARADGDKEAFYKLANQRDALKKILAEEAKSAMDTAMDEQEKAKSDAAESTRRRLEAVAGAKEGMAALRPAIRQSTDVSALFDRMYAGGTSKWNKTDESLLENSKRQVEYLKVIAENSGGIK